MMQLTTRSSANHNKKPQMHHKCTANAPQIQCKLIADLLQTTTGLPQSNTVSPYKYVASCTQPYHYHLRHHHHHINKLLLALWQIVSVLHTYDLLKINVLDIIIKDRSHDGLVSLLLSSLTAIYCILIHNYHMVTSFHCMHTQVYHNSSHVHCSSLQIHHKLNTSVRV